MSLFGPVYVILSLSAKQEAALVAGSGALVGLDTSLQRLVALLGEGSEQAVVDGLVARLRESNTELADTVAALAAAQAKGA